MKTLFERFRERLSNLAVDLSLVFERIGSRITPGNQKLHHRLKLYEQAVEQCPVSILISDNQGTIQYVNPSFERLTGYASSEVIGQNPRILKSDTHEQTYYDELWSTIRSGQIWHGEFHNLKRNGDPFWESASISPIRDASGAITNFVAVKEDVTKQRQRQIDLENACQRAEAADLAKSEFLATMSHELRTPLNSIIGLASILKENEHLASLSERSLESIQESGEQLLSMIEDILQLTSAKSNPHLASRKAFPLLPLLCEVAECGTPLATEKNIELQTDFDPALPAEISTDSNLLRRILRHLLTNAVKYTETGYVRLIAKRAPGNSVAFSVLDTGLGISNEDQKRIFEPFFQTDSSNRRKQGGAGLGLAICKELARKLEGDLSLQSSLGGGSEFSLTFPLQPATGSAPQTLYSVLDAPEARGLSVAVLLDDTLFLTLIKRLAGACNWKLHELKPHDLNSPPPQTDLVFAECRYRENAAGASGSPPVLWRESDHAPNATHALGKYPLPDKLVDTLLDSLKTGKDSASTTKSPDSESKRKQPPLADSLPLNILVVDDIASNRHVVQLILKRLGYEPQLVDGGIPFIEAVSKDIYDLVFLDLQMPDLDGPSAFAQLLADPPAHGLPKIVALTANAQEASREACLQQGMDGYLTKPVTVKAIRRHIEELFKEEASGRLTVESIAPPSKEILDHKYLASLGEELSRQQITEMLEQCLHFLNSHLNENLAVLPNLSVDNQRDEIVAMVHGLKGGFLVIGWGRAGSLCESTLDALRAGAPIDLSRFSTQLDSAMLESRKQFSAYLQSLSHKTAAR